MTPSNKKLLGVFVLIGAALTVPLLLLFAAHAFSFWLRFDFIVGCAAGWFIRSVGLRIVCWLAIAPLVVVVNLARCILLRQTGEAAGWVLIALPYLFAYGIVIAGVGTLLGALARRILVGERKTGTDEQA